MDHDEVISTTIVRVLQRVLTVIEGNTKADTTVVNEALEEAIKSENGILQGEMLRMLVANVLHTPAFNLEIDHLPSMGRTPWKNTLQQVIVVAMQIKHGAVATDHVADVIRQQQDS
jgi:hypothetical protein